jgi:hypothetical protein
VLLTASLSRYPLEGYREKRVTRSVLGTQHAKRPVELEIPITIAGMSFGALSAHAKEALGRAATATGTSTITGVGGMTPEERRASKILVYQFLPSRYGFDPDHARSADAIEVVVGQGAKPGGGMLLGGGMHAACRPGVLCRKEDLARKLPGPDWCRQPGRLPSRGRPRKANNNILRPSGASAIRLALRRGCLINYGITFKRK